MGFSNNTYMERRGIMKVRIGEKKVEKKLPISGKDKQGNLYEVTNQALMKNGVPLLPIMGEFHFSRWMPSEWEEALLKMRAGGVNIVATYVFWIHHEERKGEWDFTGCRDLHAFLEVCKKIDMPVWLRIGPWAHGECRNGGFPDWLVEELGDNGLGCKPGVDKPMHEARTDDALYLSYVKKFWKKLSEQTKGYMCKDGGPVLGIQLENEYCHAGGPRDREKGVQHMKTLKALALEYGFDVPYYTATGWGGAIVLDGETIPVLGGYVDAPWAGHIHEMPACENFLFMPFREDENIGADLKIEKEEGHCFSKENNPYFTAELGGGLQVTSHRRTYPFPEDIEAQSICMLGAGANLLGYYMYHGGVNPDGKETYLQECRETGYFNELPKKSYDFQTCIRESGKLHESYHKLKKLHLMIQNFATTLAPALAYFPDMTPESAEDLQTPRVSVRYNHDTKEGFLFINNHQRLRKMKPIKDLKIEIDVEGTDVIEISHISCESDTCAIIPFGLRMGESKLLYTNVSLLGKIGMRYVFYQHKGFDVCKEPCFIYEDAPYENVLVLTQWEAEHAYQFGEALYISECALFEKDGSIYALSDGTDREVRIYREFGEAQVKCVKAISDMTSVSVEAQKRNMNDETIKVYDISINWNGAETDELHEVYLRMDFAGDKAHLYDGNKLLTDWFSNGEEWTVALKRYGYPKNLRLEVYPFETEVYYDLPPKKGCDLLQIAIETEYVQKL